MGYIDSIKNYVNQGTGKSFENSSTEQKPSPYKVGFFKAMRVTAVSVTGIFGVAVASATFLVVGISKSLYYTTIHSVRDVNNLISSKDENIPKKILLFVAFVALSIVNLPLELLYRSVTSFIDITFLFTSMLTGNKAFQYSNGGSLAMVEIKRLLAHKK